MNRGWQEFLRVAGAVVAIGTLACGAVQSPADDSAETPPDSGPPDSAPDAPRTSTLSLTTYRTEGPVNTQLVAFQDGDGPWTALSGTAGVYTATIHGERYGLLIACTSSAYAGGPQIYYATVSDGTELYSQDCEEPAAAPAVVTGSVAGAAAGDRIRVVGPYGSSDLPSGTTSYSLSTYAGPGKLIAEELIDGRSIKLAMVAANLADGSKIDFDLSGGFAPVTRTITTNVPLAFAATGFRDAHGILSRLDQPPAPYSTFRAIPAERLGSGFNRLSASTNNGLSVIRYFKDPADVNIVFPAPLQLPQPPTSAAVPYPSVRYVIPVRTDGSDYFLQFGTNNSATQVFHSWYVNMTSAWVAKTFSGEATFAYAVPDFRGLAGWHSGFQVEAGLTINWYVDLTRSKNLAWALTLPPGAFPDRDGTEFVTATAGGELAAP